MIALTMSCRILPHCLSIPCQAHSRLASKKLLECIKRPHKETDSETHDAEIELRWSKGKKIERNLLKNRGSETKAVDNGQLKKGKIVGDKNSKNTDSEVSSYEIGERRSEGKKIKRKVHGDT